ncbi:MAG TPA: hypothetical protein VI341_02785 [Actinomycetota bacterium]
MKDDTIWERLYRACDTAWAIILPALVVGILLDLTIMRGQIPNGLLVGTWVAFWVWLLATGPRMERERAEAFRHDAIDRGLDPIIDEQVALPVGMPLLPAAGPPKNLAHTAVGGLDVFVFELETLEESHWYDDEPSMIRYTVCLHQLPGRLPRFHIEVGKGHAGTRGPWPKPTVQLPGVGSCDPLPAVVEAWICDVETMALIAGCGSPIQIRVDGEWMAALTWHHLDPWSMMSAATAFVDHIPPHVYRPMGAAMADLPAPPVGT